MKKPVKMLRGREFESRKDALGYYKLLISNCHVGQEFHSEDEPFFSDFYALFYNHQRHAEESLEHGEIVRFYIHENNSLEAYRAGKGVTAVFEDGLEAPFSYKESICGSDKNTFARVCKVFRDMVRMQTMRATDRLFENGSPVRCELTGEELTRESLELDHMAPFTFPVIVYTFLCAKGLDPDKPEDVLAPPKLGDLIRHNLVSEQMEREFLDYHARVTRGFLRAISKKAHAGVEKVQLVRAEVPVLLRAEEGDLKKTGFDILVGR